MSLMPPYQGWNLWSHYTLMFLPVLQAMKTAGAFTQSTAEKLQATIEFLRAALVAHEQYPEHLHVVTKADEEALRMLRQAVCRGEWLRVVEQHHPELAPAATDRYLEFIATGRNDPSLWEYGAPPEVEAIQEVAIHLIPALVKALRGACEAGTLEQLTERNFALIQGLVAALNVTAEQHPPVDTIHRLAA
jgi:hypothetical protein